MVYGSLVAHGKPLERILFLGKDMPKGNKPYSYLSEVNYANCHRYKLSESEYLSKCKYLRNSNVNTIWLAGDSHAASNLPAATRIASENNLNFATYTWNGLPFPLVPYRRTDNPKILAPETIVSAKIFENDLINNSKPGDIVLIFMRYHYHFGDEWLGMNDTDPSIFTYLNEDGEMYSRPDKVQHFEEWISRLENLADSLATKNV